MLIATAGHIDHGKTSLVRALTGVETDRLPEEKARGISIDLGFAYWRPDDGPMVGFVDVPGHERFVRNMIAGLSGIGFALLVVAADDGVMPQTTEHMRILDLLRVSRVIVAITKSDRVDDLRIEQVRTEVSELLAPTAFASAAIFAVSSSTSAGIPEIAAEILQRRRALGPDEAHGFRLGIDRVFSVPGAGTVVTGTVVAGHVAVGDMLTLSPLGRELRVRGMQCAGHKIARIGPEQRCALNLSGIDIAEIHRGDWLVAPSAHGPTSRIEAQFALLPDRASPLRHDSHVHFHHGAAEIAARLLIPRQQAIAPGERAVVQLVLDAPTSAVSGDRFALRDQSGRSLLGGGMILDPLASDRRRKLNERQARAAAMALPEPGDKLAALASASGLEPDVSWLKLSCNLTAQAMARILAAGNLVLVGKEQTIAIAADRFVQMGERLVAALSKYHRDHPNDGGMPRRIARIALGEPVSPELFASLLGALASAGKVESHGALVRLSGHSAGFSAMEEDVWRQVLARSNTDEPRPINLTEISRELELSEAALGAVLQRRSASGDLWKVTDNRFMLRDHIANLVALAAELGANSPAGFTAGTFRDASGIGRNFVIVLLEFFDRIGVTRRVGSCRKLRADWQAVVGTAEPWRKRHPTQ
jgi:selenocysteine-specific elongation factor